MRVLISIFKSKLPRIYWFLYWYLVQSKFLKRFSFCPELLLSSIIKKGNTVVDIGANVGQLTLSMAYLAGARGFVHAFELALEGGRFLHIQDLQPHDLVRSAIAGHVERRHGARNRLTP